MPDNEHKPLWLAGEAFRGLLFRIMRTTRNSRAMLHRLQLTSATLLGAATHHEFTKLRYKVDTLNGRIKRFERTT